MTRGSVSTRTQILLIALIACLAFGLFTKTARASDNPSIEVSNISGVSGYQIGIFGAGFGADAGTLTILGTNARIDEWTDTFVRATIPDVADGSDPEGLVLTTTAEGQVSSEFTVYTVDSKFLFAANTAFENVSNGKTLTLEGIDMTYSECSHYDTGEQINAFSFLTNYACRHDVGAKFAADSALGTEGIITIDLGEPVDGGDYLFQFFSRADWSAADANSCPGTGYPYAYVIESSTGSVLASWSDPHVSVTDNVRGNRAHYLTLPDKTQFLRLRVTDGIGDCRSDIDGRDFEMKEVRLFKVKGPRNAATRALTIYGDSITANAFNAFLGAQGLNRRIENTLPTNLPFASLGLSGRKASQLSEDFTDVNELADAYAEDDLAGSALYWGIALGTNDMNLAGPDDEGFTNAGSQFNQFDESIEADAVQWLIERGRIPILARMHDTNTANNGYGFIEAKIKILNDTDRIAAKYRLIPGPDMYTPFRLNIERDGGVWIAGDGTHLANDGPDIWVQLWADALSRAFDQVVVNPGEISPAQTAEVSLTQRISNPPSMILLAFGLGLLAFGGLLIFRGRST